MADFGRGIKAGIISGLIYMAVAAILGAIYYGNIWATPDFLYGTGLTLFTWRSFTDPSSVASLLFQYIVPGIVFGAVFAAYNNFLPSVNSTVKGVVLSAFIWIVALIEVIYTTPGWPTDGVPTSMVTGVTVSLSSAGSALAGIMAALVFGALTGFLWGRFRAKELTEERKGGSILLVSFILGLVIWVPTGVMFLVAVFLAGLPAINPDMWWLDILAVSVVFLGLPGWILGRAAWKKTKADKSGFKWGVAGGVMMALTGIMLLPGALAITGGVFSGREPANESSITATAQ